MDSEEVLDRYTVEPQTEVEWVPEWDEFPEEQPGENTHIEDDVLIWERDGFVVRLESWETTHWRAEIAIPENVGEHFARPFDLKCKPFPEYGFIKSVEMDGYTAASAEVILAANRQPVYEVNNIVDQLLEEAEQNEQFMENLEEGLAVAEDNHD